jgi:hypothetical protein
MNDDLYADPFINDALSMSEGDVHLIACVWVAGLVLAALAVCMRAITQKALERGTIVPAVARRRLKFTNAFGALAALSAPSPMAFATSADGIGSALTCELIGAVVIVLLAFCFAAALAHHGAHGTANDDDDHDYYRRSHGVNPATGYPMINSSVDAGGYPFGCGPHDSLEDRHWDR